MFKQSSVSQASAIDRSSEVVVAVDMVWGRPRLVPPFVAAALLAKLLATAAALALSESLPVIDPEVRNGVGRGNVRAVVEIRITGGVKPEGELPSPEAIETQRHAIAAAQARIRSRLAGTRFSLIRQYMTIPFLAIEIGPDALAVLETMGDAVTRVLPDTMMSRSGKGGSRSEQNGGPQ